MSLASTRNRTRAARIGRCRSTLRHYVRCIEMAPCVEIESARFLYARRDINRSKDSSILFADLVRVDWAFRRGAPEHMLFFPWILRIESSQDFRYLGWNRYVASTLGGTLKLGG